MGHVRSCLKFSKVSGGVVRCRVFKAGKGHPALSPLLKCKNLRSQKYIRPGAKRCGSGRGRRR